MIEKSVPFFRYPHLFVSQAEEFLNTTRTVGERGAFIMQQELLEFEANLAAYTGAKYAIGVANATDGLQMGFMAAELPSGGEVVFCSHTMVATASAIHFSGLVPVPAEAGPDHLIDPKGIEKAITSRTVAICPTQLNGRTADMDIISEIADRHQLKIFEDAAQALGSKWKNRTAGTFGLASCISFYPAKILGCLGDGGAVLVDDKEIYDRIMLMRDHGRGHDGDVHMWGFNSRLDNLQAAYLNFQLARYDDVVSRRREIALMYQRGLEHLSQLVLPPAPGSDENHFDVFQNYEIEAENRDVFQSYLKDCGVGSLVPWGGKAVHQFRKLGFAQKLPSTDRLFDRLVMIPLNMSMSDDDVMYVIDVIRAFYH